MIKYSVFLFLALFSGNLLSDTGPDHLKLIYSGFSLKIPKDPVAIGHMGQASDSLIIKYSESSGKKYIGVSKEVDLNFEDCNPNEFFEMALGDSEPTGCENSVIAFRKVFVDKSNHGIWAGPDHNFYYFLDGDDSSFLFFVLDSGLVIKLESDFLGKSEFKKALSDHI